MQKEQIKEEIKPGLKTHVRDGHGKLIASNPYRCHIRAGVKYFEYPVMSGNLWYERDGFFVDPAGRIDVKGVIDDKAEHITYVPPKTGTEVVVAENAMLKQKTETLQRELDAIRKEQSAKTIEKKAAEMVTQSEKKTAPAANTAKETK